MGITAAHTLFPKHFKRLSILAFLMLSLATAVQSAPRNGVQKPPVDTSTMPDSINRLIENIFSLIDSLEIKDSTRVDMHIDTTRLVRDTIIVTTQFVEDSIISAELMHQIDSIVGKDILTQAPDKPLTDTLALAPKVKKDTLRKIMPKPKPLQMCARHKPYCRNPKTDLPSHHRMRFLSIPSSCQSSSTANAHAIFPTYTSTTNRPDKNGIPPTTFPDEPLELRKTNNLPNWAITPWHRPSSRTPKRYAILPKRCPKPFISNA